MRYEDGKTRDLILRALAVVLMLAGAVILIADVGAGIGFPLVAVGAALTAIVETNRRRHRGPAH
jgi:H+/Cl- antiporter ClcA